MNDNKGLIQFAFNEIEKRIGNLKCPLCDNTSKDNFHISEQFYHIPSMTEDEYTEEGQTASVRLKVPLNIMRTVPVSCMKCGHVMFFNFDMVKGEE